MKKYLSLLFATTLAAAAFTACEDVPAPYEVNDDGPGPSDVIIDEDFSTSLGEFTSFTTVGSFPWSVSYSCAQVTAYEDTDGDGQKEDNEATSWLVSDIHNLTDVEAAHISFDYILRYATNSQLSTHYQLLVSADYAGAGRVDEATWTPLEFNLVQGSDWNTWYESGNVNLPAEFCGQPTVTVALRYVSTTKAATWEVKNFLMEVGAGDYQPGGADDTHDDARSLPYAEAFSTELGGFKSYTASGSGEWVIDYSTAKATGYDNATQTTTAGTYLLVSPPVNISEQAHVAYEYILRYNRTDANQQLLVSANFDPANPDAGWTVLKADHTEGSDWTTFSTADINVPAELVGQTVRFAFRYNTDATSGSTWEVKNFSVAAGQASGQPSHETGHDGLHQLPYTEAFTTTLGDYASYTASGSGEWVIDYSTAKATGYDNATQTTTAGTYLLVSPPISLQGVQEAHFSYEYILRYNRTDANQQLLITANFDPANPDAGWTVLKADHTEGSDWTTFYDADVAIPAQFLGQTVRLAFRYSCDASSASTWEVRNATIAEGKVGESTGGGDDNTGSDAVPNGDFENWTNGVPNHWKSTTSASRGTMEQVTDAHGGQYAVQVAGTTSRNNRLAYEEITLPAGAYTMRFYCKAATETGGTVRPGYTQVVDGAASSQYQYGEYVENLTTSEWREVTHQFTLASETTLNLVIMVSQRPGGSVIFDDFTLTNAAGEQIIY